MQKVVPARVRRGPSYSAATGEPNLHGLDRELSYGVIARSEATKRSSECAALDCFASLAMTRLREREKGLPGGEARCVAEYIRPSAQEQSRMIGSGMRTARA